MAYPHPYGSDFFQISAGLFKQGFNQFFYTVLDVYLFVRRNQCKIMVKKWLWYNSLPPHSLVLLKLVRTLLPGDCSNSSFLKNRNTKL